MILDGLPARQRRTWELPRAGTGLFSACLNTNDALQIRRLYRGLRADGVTPARARHVLWMALMVGIQAGQR